MLRQEVEALLKLEGLCLVIEPYRWNGGERPPRSQKMRKKSRQKYAWFNAAIGTEGATYTWCMMNGNGATNHKAATCAYKEHLKQLELGGYPAHGNY